MSNQAAYIKLVQGSKQESISLSELKDMFTQYKSSTHKTGTQINWDYTAASFPYEISETEDGAGKWFYLKANKGEDRYKYIVFGVGTEDRGTTEGEVVSEYYIQVVLPEGATYGDKGKANEFCKYLGYKLGGEVQLFNGRTMYFNKRK